jgi:VWFA-related protein
MYKNLIILVVLLFGFSVITAQIKDEKLPKTDATKQTEYSESTPYQPRAAELTTLKKKKEKKSKTDPDKVVQPANEIASKENTLNKTVRIPVFVYDQQGKPLTDLQNSDFKVFVDDKEQEISAFETAKTPHNILLILDTSPSLAYKDEDLRSVVSKLIEALQPADKLQIISFNESVDVINKATNDAAILQKAVKKIQMGGGTSIYEAIRTINKKYLAANVEQPVIILLTDGVDTTSLRASYITSLVEAEKSGAVVFPFYFDSAEFFKKIQPRLPLSVFGNVPRSNVGLTDAEYDLGRAYLKDIAALSGGRTFAVKNLSQVKKEDFDAALKFINPNYYLSISGAPNSGAFERKQIKVRVNRPNLSVRARGSYVTGEN